MRAQRATRRTALWVRMTVQPILPSTGRSCPGARPTRARRRGWARAKHRRPPKSVVGRRDDQLSVYRTCRQLACGDGVDGVEHRTDRAAGDSGTRNRSRACRTLRCPREHGGPVHGPDHSDRTDRGQQRRRRGLLVGRQPVRLDHRQLAGSFSGAARRRRSGRRAGRSGADGPTCWRTRCTDIRPGNVQFGDSRRVRNRDARRGR